MRLTAPLEIAGTAGFFTQAVGDTPTPPDARTYHLRLSHAGRSHTLAILIRLTCRALHDRQVLTPETMTDEDCMDDDAIETGISGVQEAHITLCLAGIKY